MFIEFTLQENSPGFLGSHIFKMVDNKVKDWANVNEIPYTSKYYKNTFRVAFDDDKHYTVFRLTWTDLPDTEYKIIDRTW
jgi:hypothetical protein